MFQRKAKEHKFEEVKFHISLETNRLILQDDERLEIRSTHSHIQADRTERHIFENTSTPVSPNLTLSVTTSPETILRGLLFRFSPFYRPRRPLG